MSPPAVPNWLQSPLKPRARLCMEVVTDRGDQRPRVDLNEIREWARSKADSALKWNRVLVSASKVQWPELSQLSLCSEFNKENSMEFSLISLLLIHFTTVAMHLLSHGPHVTLVMWHTVTMTVTWLPITLLWYYDKVMWYFPTLYLVVVSLIRKKKNIDNNLAILPSHDSRLQGSVGTLADANPTRLSKRSQGCSLTGML